MSNIDCLKSPSIPRTERVLALRGNTILRITGAMALAALAAVACSKDSEPSYSAVDCDFRDSTCQSCFDLVRDSCKESCGECLDNIFEHCKEWDKACEEEMSEEDSDCQSCTDCETEGEDACRNAALEQSYANRDSAVCE